MMIRRDLAKNSTFMPTSPPRVCVSFATSGRADRAVQQRSAQLVENRAAMLPAPHGAGVAVGDDGQRVARCNSLQARRRSSSSASPTDRLKLARALGPDAPQRLQDAFRGSCALGVTRDLGTQHAASLCVIVLCTT
jgi:hypothetical protein